MSDRFKVTESAKLMDFLLSNLKGWSRTTVKQRLKSGCVIVNGQSIVKHNHTLAIGDEVEVLASGKNMPRKTGDQLEIIYSDRNLIAINKPAGLLSVSSAKETRKHALAMLRNQLSSPRRPVKLWPVHRLDRDTSGILLFATSHEMREAIMELWPEAEKRYLAIVEGFPDPGQGTINQPLRQDDTEYRVHVGEHPDAKRAVTHFESQRSVNGRTLLELTLETGRQHQIRAHLAWQGHPVVGDQRYGVDGPRMGLHALSLEITEPITGNKLLFETPAPSDFYALLK